MLSLPLLKRGTKINVYVCVRTSHLRPWRVQEMGNKRWGEKEKVRHRRGGRGCEGEGRGENWREKENVIGVV